MGAGRVHFSGKDEVWWLQVRWEDEGEIMEFHLLGLPLHLGITHSRLQWKSPGTYCTYLDRAMRYHVPRRFLGPRLHRFNKGTSIPSPIANLIYI